MRVRDTMRPSRARWRFHETLRMTGTDDPLLVALSVVLAVLASYIALDTSSRIEASRGRTPAWYWLIGGAVSVGIGFWSMHFIGLLAFDLPIPMSFDPSITLLSLLIAVLASGFALSSVSMGTPSVPRLVGVGMVMGVGIVAMHYTGMTALQIDPRPRNDPLLVGLSVLLAVAASLVGVWTAFRLRREQISSAFRGRAGGALVMAAGIAGMHYTAMAGTAFDPQSTATVDREHIGNSWLAAAVGIFALELMATTLLISGFDAYLAERAREYADSLRHLNVALQARVVERTTGLDRMDSARVEVEAVERRQLSRELHDRVGQNLTALGINLRIMMWALSDPDRDRAALSARMEDSIALVEATVDSIENVMSELHPPMLDEYGLLPALHWQANVFSQRTGIAVTVRGDEPAERPSQAIETTLFRIVQEALTNVAKHARATRVEVRLDRSRAGWLLSVADNGVGFDHEPEIAATAHTARGVMAMRERAQMIGGLFEVGTQAGGGTRVTVRVND